MPLPLFALLALAGTGGAVTGYAGEVQRKKLKAEEDAQFLERLDLQTGKQKELAQFQSKLDIEKEEAKNKAATRRLALKYNLDPDIATLSDIRIAENLANLATKKEEAKITAGANLGIFGDFTQDEYLTAKKKELKQKSDIIEQREKNVEEFKNDAAAKLLQAQMYDFYGKVNVPNVFGKVNSQPVNLFKSTYLAQKYAPDEARSVRVKQFEDNLPFYEKIFSGAIQASPQLKSDIMNEFVSAAFDLNEKDLISEKIIEEGPNQGDMIKYYGQGTIDSRFKRLSRSPYFGPILTEMSANAYRTMDDYGEFIDNHIFEITGERNISVPIGTDVNKDTGDVTIVMEILGENVPENTVNAFNAVRKQIKNIRPNDTDLNRIKDFKNITTVSKKALGGFHLRKGEYVQGNPNGSGMYILDMIENYLNKGYSLEQLGEVSETIQSKNSDQQKKIATKKKSKIRIAGTRVAESQPEFYDAILQSASKANIFRLRPIIQFAKLGATDNLGNFPSANELLHAAGYGDKNTALASTIKNYKSLSRMDKFGRALIQTAPNERIINTAMQTKEFQKYAEYHQLVGTGDVEDARFTTELAGFFLSLFNDTIVTLTDQVPALGKSIFGTDGYEEMTLETEKDFVGKFFSFFTDSSKDSVNKFRFEGYSKDDPDLIKAFEKAERITYDEASETFVNHGKFKSVDEYIAYEKDAYNRNVQRLQSIQNRLQSNSATEVLEARRDFLKFMMAYELASFMQGGTGGRTISDQDVENMLRAIGTKKWSTVDGMIGGTLQLLTANAHELDLYQGLSSGDPATIQSAIWTAEKIMPLISNDYTKGVDPRTLLNNLIEGQDPPAGKNNQQGSQGGMSDQFEISVDAAGNIISNKSSEQTTFLTPNQDAIKALIGNPTPERINQFVELYGQNNLTDILKENK